MTGNKALVIFLHGVGSRGDDLIGLASIWRNRLSETAYAAPDGPLAFDRGGPGYQWFSVAGITDENRPARVVAARAAFDATLDRIIEQEGFIGREDRVALVGFSQGSIMALDMFATGRRNIGAVVAFSGRLSSPEPLSPHGAPLLLLHGTADPVIPCLESDEARQRLQDAGANVRLKFLPGVGHTISREGAEEAGEFLAAAI